MNINQILAKINFLAPDANGICVHATDASMNFSIDADGIFMEYPNRATIKKRLTPVASESDAVEAIRNFFGSCAEKPVKVGEKLKNNYYGHTASVTKITANQIVATDDKGNEIRLNLEPRGATYMQRGEKGHARGEWKVVETPVTEPQEPETDTLYTLIEQLEADCDGEKVYDSIALNGKTYLYEMNSRPYLNNQVYALYRYHNCGSIDNQLGYAERRADGCLNAFIGARRIGQFWELDEAFMAIIEASETPVPVTVAPVEPVIETPVTVDDACEKYADDPNEYGGNFCMQCDTPCSGTHCAHCTHEFIAAREAADEAHIETVETPVVELRQLDGEFVAMVKPTVETPAETTIDARAEIAAQLIPHITGSKRNLAVAIGVRPDSLSQVLGGRKMGIDTLEKLMVELNLAFRPSIFMPVWTARNMETLDSELVIDHYLLRKSDFEPITATQLSRGWLLTPNFLRAKDESAFELYGVVWRIVRLGKHHLVASRHADGTFCRYVVER